METLTSTQVYAGPWLGVREDTVRRADGSTGTHAVVESADIVLVVPVDGDRVHLVKHHRHPVGARRWELPSGSTDDRLDADPAAVAARELREETGLVAGTLTPLGVLEVLPSTTAQRCHVFLATDLVPGPAEREPAEQDMRTAWFDRADVERMVRDGGLTDAKSVAAYALLRLQGWPAQAPPSVTSTSVAPAPRRNPAVDPDADTA